MAVPAYYVLMDSNIWMSERLLYGPLGGALLHALAKNRAMIAVPEIVQREVEHNVAVECERQVGVAKKAFGYLRQITQQGGNFPIPDQENILQKT